MTDSPPDPTDKHVGSRIRMRRLALGMTQVQLANALGITYQQVQKYENGNSRISAGRLQHLADILEVTPSFFFEDAPVATVKEDHLPDPRYITDFLILTDGHALAKAFMCINDQKVRHRVVSLVEEIASKFE